MNQDQKLPPIFAGWYKGGSFLRKGVAPITRLSKTETSPVLLNGTAASLNWRLSQNAPALRKAAVPLWASLKKDTSDADRKFGATLLYSAY